MSLTRQIAVDFATRLSHSLKRLSSGPLLNFLKDAGFAQRSKVTSWLRHITVDGKTLPNTLGTSANLTAVNCLSFDGANDYVEFNHTLVDQQDFVVEWEGVMGAVSNNDAFWSLLDDSGSNRGSYIRYEHTNTRFLARIGTTTITSPSITLAENDVVKLTTTISNSGTRAWAVIVVNGVTTNLFTNQTLNTVPEFDGTGRIGRLTPLSTSQFKGKVSSFKITQGEVNVHFPLAEGSGTKIYDVSGNGNHGTIINDATWSTLDGIESWNHEYGFDAAAVFDGTDDYINTGVSATDEYTFEVTAKLNSNGDYQGYFQADKRFNFGRGTNTTVRLGYLTFNNTATVATSIFDKFTNYKIQDGKLFIDGVEALDSGITPSGTTLGNLYIGARFNDISNVADEFVNQELKNAKIYDNNGVLVRDFVPSEDGLYDKVNGVYYSNDGTGTITTKRIPALNTKTKQVATFDGVDDYVDTGVSDQLVKKYSVTFTPNVISDAVILGLRISRPACFELMSDGSIRTGLSEGEPEARGNSLGANRTAATTIVAGTKYTVEVDYDNNEIKINDVVQSTFATSGRNHRDDNVWIGGRFDLGALQHPFNGIIHNVKLESATAVLAEYDFQNDIGTTTVQDLTTNNNDGTASIGTANVNTGAGGLAEFWGQRVADASGSLVSADYATGNTSISNPAGYVHNNSECGVKLQSRSVITGDGVDDFVTLPSLTTVRSKTIATKIKFPAAILSEADNEEGAVYGTSTGSGTPNLAIGFTRDGSSGTTKSWFFRDGNYVAGGYEQTQAASNYATDYAGKTLWVIFRVDNENHQLHADIEGVINTTTNKSFDANATVPKTLFETGIGGWVAATASSGFGKVPIFDFIYYERVLSDSEVEGIYSGTIPSGAAYQYDFSEGQGTTITDSTSNGNNATATIGAGGTELFWADSYREYSATNLFSHTNGTNNTWVQEAGTNITKLVQYDADDTTLTSTEQADNERYFG